MLTLTTDGVILLSMAISFTARCTSRSNSCCVGMVNSEQWRKQKKGNAASYSVLTSLTQSELLRVRANTI